MGETKIQWTNKTWNPLRARNRENGEVGWFCEHVSHGCDNCYAEKMNINTYFGNGEPYKASSLPSLELFLDEKMLEAPLHWRKPQNIFPCSMTDLFGRFVKDEWIDKMAHVMSKAHWHTFQTLTKRADRMLDYMKNPNLPNLKPISNWWLGVSVEDQKTADERIPLLLETPATVRWVSAEPLIGLINLDNYLYTRFQMGGARHMYNQVDWVVVGGESGSKSRRCYVPSVRRVVKQCQAAGVPVFVKQLGALIVDRNDAGFDGSDSESWPVEIEQNDAIKYDINGYREEFQGADARILLRNRKGGDMSEWPEDLRVREFPKAA